MAEITRLPTAAEATALRGFRTAREEQHHMAEKGEEPALIFNPNASLRNLFAAASSRAQTLHIALDSWTCVEKSDSVRPYELAMALEPIAQEIELVLDELRRRLHEVEEGHHG